MLNDLVERLENAWVTGCYELGQDEIDDLLKEAAEEIRRLRSSPKSTLYSTEK